MKTLRFLAYSLFIFCLFSCGDDDNLISNPEPSDSPNILLIIGDDIGIDAFPGYSIGSAKANLPNLESLMNEGLVFENAWANPLCSPTRATILTGKYAYHTGVYTAGDEIDLNEVSLQQNIKSTVNSDYETAIIGKWHLSGNNMINPQDPLTMGIDYFAGMLGGGVPDYYEWKLTQSGTLSTSTEYATTKLTDLAIDWIGSKDQPWFLWLAYNAAHTPFHLPDESMHSQGNLPADEASIDENPEPYYLAMIEAMDFEIGRLLNSMSQEERENTTIIFIGDNGTPLKVAQEPYGRAKGQLYQGGVHVPMFASGKGVGRKGEREAALINSSDLFTTISQIAGSPVTEVNNSKSFFSLLSDENANKRSFVYAEGNLQSAPAWTIRNDSYKLIHFDDGTEEFYKLVDDPGETNDLLLNELSAEEMTAKEILEAEVDAIQM